MAKNLYTGPGTFTSPDQTTHEVIVPSSEPSDYPKWKYHSEKPAVVIDSAEQETSLGAEWKDSPAEFEPKEEKAE
jgi:hypothetical protein